MNTLYSIIFCLAIDDDSNLDEEFTSTPEKQDPFKKFNMVRKTLEALKEEQRLEFEKAKELLERGEIKVGIFLLEKIMHEDGLLLPENIYALRLGYAYFENDMLEQFEKYIDFVTKEFPTCPDVAKNLKNKLHSKEYKSV